MVVVVVSGAGVIVWLNSHHRWRHGGRAGDGSRITDLNCDWLLSAMPGIGWTLKCL